MNRRDFLRGLVGGAASAVVANKLPAPVEAPTEAEIVKLADGALDLDLTDNPFVPQATLYAGVQWLSRMERGICRHPRA